MSEAPVSLPFVAVLVTDLYFVVPIADAIRAAGARPYLVDDAAQLADAIDLWPALVIIDLAAAGNWLEVVRRAKAMPDTRPIPVVAFGSHVNAAALQAARAAGCDHAWARSRFVTGLPQLLQQALHPAAPPPEGWDQPPPPALITGIQQFNDGDYWTCHETLEELWRADSRPIRSLYQGILQVGVAFHHLRARNYSGALKCLRRGLPRLRTLPPVCQGVAIATFTDEALRVHDRLTALGADGIAGFDLSSLPRLELSPASRLERP